MVASGSGKGAGKGAGGVGDGHADNDADASYTAPTPTKRRAANKPSTTPASVSTPAGGSRRNESLISILRLTGDVQFDAIKSRLQELERQRDSQLERDIEHQVDAEFGARPPAPHKPRLNPYLVYVKDAWDECRQVADAEERDRLTKAGATAGSIAAAKADKNHIRAVVGRMWRELTDEGKKRWVDLMDVMKSDYEVALGVWKEACRGWDERAAQLKAEVHTLVQQELFGSTTNATSTGDGDGDAAGDGLSETVSDDAEDGKYVTYEESRLRRALASLKAERRRKPRKSDAHPPRHLERQPSPITIDPLL